MIGRWDMIARPSFSYQMLLLFFVFNYLESHDQGHGEHRQYEHRQHPSVAAQQGERGRGVLVDARVGRSRGDYQPRRGRVWAGRQQEHVRVHPHPPTTSCHLYHAGCRLHVIAAWSSRTC